MRSRSKKDTFKPISEYVTADGVKKLKIFVEELSSYIPEVKFCDLDSTVEFLNRDGSYSKAVTLGPHGPVVKSPFKILKSSNIFVYKSRRRKPSINIGYDPSCHLHVRSYY